MRVIERQRESRELELKMVSKSRGMQWPWYGRDLTRTWEVFRLNEHLLQTRHTRMRIQFPARRMPASRQRSFGRFSNEIRNITDSIVTGRS